VGATVVNDLIEFLRARLDDEEHDARRSRSLLLIAHTDRCAVSGSDEEATFRHFDRHAPARVLAEVDAKRRHISRWAYVNGLLDDAVDPSFIRNELLSVRRAYYNVLLDDALPYSGHPDYRQEWKP
jgi:hypothetical protein